MATIPSGQMRHKVRVEENTPSQNSVGEFVDSWAYKLSVFAQIRSVSGTEIDLNDQRFVNATHIVTTHWTPGITEKMRLLWHPTQGSTTTLHIEYTENVDEQNHTLILLARRQS